MSLQLLSPPLFSLVLCCRQMGGAERDMDKTDEGVGQSPYREKGSDENFRKVKRSEKTASSGSEHES